MANFRVIEDAVRAAIMAATGLPGGQVVFANQNAPAPEGDYITIDFSGPFTVGGHLTESNDYDSNRPAGQEIELRIESPGILTVSLQCFTVATTASTADAQALLSKVQVGLQLEDNRSILRSSGLAIFDFGKVLSVPRVYGFGMEGRCTLEMRGYTLTTATARTGYISTCVPTGTALP